MSVVLRGKVLGGNVEKKGTSFSIDIQRVR